LAIVGMSCLGRADWALAVTLMDTASRTEVDIFAFIFSSCTLWAAVDLMRDSVNWLRRFQSQHLLCFWKQAMVLSLSVNESYETESLPVFGTGISQGVSSPALRKFVFRTLDIVSDESDLHDRIG
jgi:hypothetical protein